MRRRQFIALVGRSSLLLPLYSAGLGRSVRGEESAFKVPIGRECPDPFCLRTDEGWYLMGTSGRYSDDYRIWNLHFSADLKSWERRGLRLVLPDYEGSRRANYWAPELLRRDGKYYLYYTSDSFGDPYRRYVRVGVSDEITGPYIDSGKPLTRGPSIDGHPHYVSADDGWMIYTGNEGNDHVGQLIIDRMTSPTKLAGEPRKVFPDETLPWEEGGFVVKQGGSFLLFSSQGNWRDGSYHVLAARAKRINGPWERIKAGGENRRVVSTIEGQWGAGHNSAFIGPGGRHYICYHAWDRERTGRYAWIAPIRWEDGFPLVKQ
jgi:beta-xylosidase